MSNQSKVVFLTATCIFHDQFQSVAAHESPSDTNILLLQVIDIGSIAAVYDYWDELLSNFFYQQARFKAVLIIRAPDYQ